MSCTWLYWAVLNCTGLYWAALDSTWLFWADVTKIGNMAYEVDWDEGADWTDGVTGSMGLMGLMGLMCLKWVIWNFRWMGHTILFWRLGSSRVQKYSTWWSLEAYSTYTTLLLTLLTPPLTFTLCMNTLFYFDCLGHQELKNKAHNWFWVDGWDGSYPSDCYDN